MATEQELERLIVRIMGDASHYQKILDEATRATMEAMRKLEQEKGIITEQNRLLQEAARITESVRTPAERYSTIVSQLNSQLAAGRISQETYNRAVARAKTDLDSASGAAAGLKTRIIALSFVAKEFGTSWNQFVTAPIRRFLSGAGSAALEMATIRKGLEAVTGSVEGMEAAMKKVDEIAKLPGLGFKEAATGIRDLLATGRFGLEEATQALKGFGSAVATTGGGKAELDAVMRQVIQMIGMGKVMEQDLRIIKSYIPGLGKAMEDVFGTSNAALIAQGTSAEKFVSKITKHFAETSKITGGAKNDIENLSDTWFKAMASIGESVLQFAPAINIVAELVKKAAEWFATLDKDLQATIVIVLAVAAALGPLAAGLGSIIGLVTTLVGVFSGPVGWIGLLIGLAAVVGGTFAVKKAMKSMEESSKSAATEAKKAMDAVTTRPVLPDLAAMKAEEKEMKKLKSEIESLTKSARTPFEVLEDKIILATKALKAGIIEMATFTEIAEDVAFDRLKLELEESKKLTDREITPKAGAIALRGTSEEFRARRGAVDTAAEVLKSDKRREMLAERSARILDEILAAIKVDKPTSIPVVKKLAAI